MVHKGLGLLGRSVIQGQLGWHKRETMLESLLLEVMQVKLRRFIMVFPFMFL